MLMLLTGILFVLDARGQITKGYWMMGGNINYSSITTKSEASTQNTEYNIQIVPDIGYFFADKLVAGLKSNINKQGTKLTGDSSGYNRYTDFNIGPFVRYYFLRKDKIINLLAEGDYEYGFNASSIGETKGEHTSKNTLAISAGPVAYFNSSVSLEFLMGYSSEKFVHFRGRNNTIKLSLGLQFYLERTR